MKFTVKESSAGPDLMFGKISVRSWIGTASNEAAHKLCNELNNQNSNKVEMSLVCPKCNTHLKFGDGHDVDPQCCTPPHEFCPNMDCDFVITYEEKEPDNISDFMDKNGLGPEDMVNDITLPGGLS